MKHKPIIKKKNIPSHPQSHYHPHIVMLNSLSEWFSFYLINQNDKILCCNSDVSFSVSFFFICKPSNPIYICGWHFHLWSWRAETVSTPLLSVDREDKENSLHIPRSPSWQSSSSRSLWLLVSTLAFFKELLPLDLFNCVSQLCVCVYVILL